MRADVRGRGLLTTYLVLMAGLWSLIFGLAGALGNGWSTGAGVLFTLSWIGLTTALYWAWRVVLVIIHLTARASAAVGRAAVRVIRA